MKFTKQDLLTLLIGLFLFASCKDANTIGLTPEGDSPIKGILDNTVLVESKTVLDSPTASIGLIRHPLGNITKTGDPIFGATEANLSMTVSLPSNSYSFGGIPIVDSAILVLPYSTQFYGDTTTTEYTFTVKQLTNDLSVQKIFLSNRVWPADEADAAVPFTTKLKPKTPFEITDVLTGKPDTPKVVVPQLRIKLKNEFIQSKIVNLDSARRSTNIKFAHEFKGLQVKATANGPGGIMFVNFGGTDSKIEIYYRKQIGTSVIEKDTVAVSFPISSSSGPIAAYVNHNYDNTPIKDQLDHPTAPYQVTYLQALSGVRNKISFPDLKAFVERVKAGNSNARVVINRAELVVNISNGTDVSPWNPAQRLSLYRLDIAGQRGNIPDNDGPTQANPSPGPTYAGSEAAFGGFFDPINKRYIFTVTSYLQALIDDKTKDYGTYLSPSSLTEYNIFPSLTSGARSIINTATPAANEKGIKLNIYYTRVD